MIIARWWFIVVVGGIAWCVLSRLLLRSIVRFWHEYERFVEAEQADDNYRAELWSKMQQGMPK